MNVNTANNTVQQSNRKKNLRQINGVLLLDKPNAITSNGALQITKRLYAAQKAGHTGSLDPLATGMLPICFGEATKFSQYLLDADKTYSVAAKLGIKTTTGDAEGEVIEEHPIPEITPATLATLLNNFRGEILQVPSMYSALKHQGRPLYELARKGISVERPARKVMIYDLNLISFAGDILNLTVSCSKGTYIRTLVEDIGTALQCGAHVIELRRTAVGPYQESQMISLNKLEQAAQQDNYSGLDKYLLPVDSSVEHWTQLTISPAAAFYLMRGQSIVIPHAPTHGWLRLQLADGKFLGVGEILDDGRVAPRRLISQND